MSRPNSKQSMLHSGSNNSMHTTTATHILMVLLIAVLLCGQFFYFQRCRSDSFMINLRHNLGGSGGGGGSGSITPDSITPDSITTSTTGTNREKKEEPFFQGQHFDVCIAGAGLSGAVLAERYATELGYKVLVVEKRNHIGGNCYDYIDQDTGVRISRYGAHLFHTSYEDVWDYVQRFGPWHTYHHKVRGIVNGKDVPIPPNIETINTLFDANLKTPQDMEQWLESERVPNDNPKNSEEVALSSVGKRLYELIFKPYTFKQWAKYPVELGPEVLQRIPVRNSWEEGYFNDPHQALPTNGYTSLFEEMFKSQHITVLTSTDYFQIRDKISCGHHYFSGPIDAYFAHHNLPKLEYRSLEFERKVEYDTSFFQQAFVVNHPQAEDGDFTRIVEYKHLYNQSDLPDTVYFIERSKDDGEPYYPVPNQKNKDLYSKYQQLARQEEQRNNVTFVGRLANYKYFNMDQAIKNALDLFTTKTGIPYQITPDVSNLERIENLQFEPAIDAAGESDMAATPSLSSSFQNIVPSSPPEKSLMLPDWRQAVDCSAWDTMCATLQTNYLPYPFPYGVKLKQDLQLNYKPMSASSIPSEWKTSLQNNKQSLYEEPIRPIEYIFPPKVSKADRDACVEQANTMPWQDQLQALFDKNLVKRDNVTNMVVYTISDYNYAFDMLHDIFEMNDKVVDFAGSFFMVAIDKPTVDLACTYGYPIVAWPSATHSESTENLKMAVANTKFEVSLELVKKRYNFFFYEMDVWFIKSPKEVIQHFHARDQGEGDILLSSHQNCPMCANIGVFSVLANERTQEYFEICILMAQESPQTHDQWIMAQVLALAQAIKNGGTLKFENRWDPPPKHNPPEMTKPVGWGLLSAHEIVASERPIATHQTYAVHTLNGVPLRKPHGKKILAKELGVWYGFEGPNGEGGYYQRKGDKRRYLWMDGHMPNSYSPVLNVEYEGWESGLFHDELSFKYTMATLLALARRTGRIFVIPKFVADHGVHYVWNILDFETVEAMQIDYRETNFPHNPKSWSSKDVPFENVTRTALGAIADAGMENSMMVQSFDGTIDAWKFDDGMDEMEALDAWWALHTSIPQVDSAELLLVNPHIINRAWANRMEQRVSKKLDLGVAGAEIVAVYNRLKWCFDPKSAMVTFENVVGRSSPEYDCHGKGV